ncbi:hypothetical protein JL09_g4938, partial [Pichia kudriavzevii]
MAAKTETVQGHNNETLEVVNDIPIDKQIEELIRSHKELSITRSSIVKFNYTGGADPEGLKLLP